jgi:hypothetical protein
MKAVGKHVPARTATEHRDSKGWLTHRCLQAVADKRQADGSSAFRAKQEHCTRILREEYLAYVNRNNKLLAS